MNDWFEWKGQRCTDLGIHVMKQPDITLPKERVKTETVFGRSGTLTKLEGDAVFEEMILNAECCLDITDNLSAVCAYLRGGGNVMFANRPTGYYEARINNQISLEQVMRGRGLRTFVVNFRCQPYFYHSDSAQIVLTENTTFVNNPGTAESAPLITIAGSGNITLMVGTQIVVLTDVAGSVTLDSTLMEAYKGASVMNDHMSGAFPMLAPGQNAVSWTGTVTSVTIDPHWRDL